MGLNYAPLQDEVLDHICCLIETQMMQDADFNQAKTLVFSNLSTHTIQQWQRATIHATNRGKRIMKHITLITSGLAASCLLITSVITAQDVPNINPLTKVVVTSHYGERVDPISKKKRHHQGIDLRASVGTPVNVTADGTVSKIEEDPQGYGKYILVDHGNNVFSKYAQLSKFMVVAGDKVTRGQVIALAGNTGASTGPHLHYEVIKNNQSVDPKDYMLEL